MLKGLGGLAGGLGGGLAGLGDMGKMLKAAQEMQSKMAAIQDELTALTVTGESGAGLVRATSTGKGTITALTIDPSILVASEQEVVEDLILAAIKDAQGRAAARYQAEMAKLTDGMGLPPGMKLPF